MHTARLPLTSGLEYLLTLGRLPDTEEDKQDPVFAVSSAKESDKRAPALLKRKQSTSILVARSSCRQIALLMALSQRWCLRKSSHDTVSAARAEFGVGRPKKA
jgi:hypothetical protein